MSSTTPRVDSVMRAAGNMMANAVVVDAPMARMLEIELRDASQELERLRADAARLKDECDTLRELDKLNTDQMQRDTKLIERLRTDVALLRDALATLVPIATRFDASMTIGQWRALEDARQALEKTKP